MNAQKKPHTTSHHGPSWVTIVIAIVAIIAVVWIWRVNHKTVVAKPPPPVPVTSAPAHQGNVEVAIPSLGTVTSECTVTVTSRVAGTVTELHYTEGQTVKKGDLIAVIDPRPYDAALLQAKGQLARDRAQLANAKLDLDRYTKAFQQHAVPQQQVATSQAAVDGDEGLVKLDQGSLDAAQVNVDYTRITSPIDGRVGLRLVDLGNVVAANGTTGIVTITQMKPITVVFTIPQDFLADVSKHMQAGQPLKVQALDRTQKHAVADGTLLTVDNQVDQATGTVKLKAVFPNDDEALWPGEFVNVRLVTNVLENAITVPARAVQNGPTGNYLFVVKPDMTVETRQVEQGQVEQGVAVVTKGVAAGENVVVDGQYRLEQGTKVSLQKPQKPAGS